MWRHETADLTLHGNPGREIRLEGTVPEGQRVAIRMRFVFANERSYRRFALPHLTDEQIRTWNREQKDRWWHETVYRGDMPQLTWRAAVTGFFLGGILSATNLYVGAKTGWTLGVGITSVILVFAMFKVLSRLGAKDMTILENNCMQSVATAAGYMTGPLVSGMAAYMMIENKLLPWWQMLLFNVVLSVMGVLVAFPMKRRFINDEQQPFPEGRACGVVLDTLYTSSAAVGLFKAKALMIAAGVAGFLKLISGENIMKWLQVKLLGLKSSRHLPEHLDHLYYWMVGKGWLPVPRLAGVDIRQLGLSPTMDLAMIGAGGLMGIRAATSLLVGMIVNFCIVVPAMIFVGEIQPKADGTFSRIHVVNTWALWWSPLRVGWQKHPCTAGSTAGVTWQHGRDGRCPALEARKNCDNGWHTRSAIAV